MTLDFSMLNPMKNNAHRVRWHCRAFKNEREPTKRHIFAQNLKNGMIARQEILIEGQIPGRYINRS